VIHSATLRTGFSDLGIGGDTPPLQKTTYLRSYKIHKLSARYGRTIYSAEIEADLRAVFYLEGDLIVTVDIGSHSIYRR
jgi:mRNA-degrading endonuclease YafQ of YafQ-DinJ toxin-antitoxin module